MANLPIQIVDENDNPVGSSIPRIARLEGLHHRIVRTNVLDKHGRMLLQLRNPDMEMFPGCWDNSSAGHVDAGEDYLTAAIRELKEEIGLEVSVLEEVGYYHIDVRLKDNIIKRFVRAYNIVLDDPLPEFKLQASEVSAVKWMAIKDVKDLIKNSPDKVSDGLIEVIERLF